MKFLFLCLLVFSTSKTFSQENGDSRIIIALNDTAGTYQKIKIALVKNNFIVKEDGNPDTLTTYPRELNKIPGYSVVWVAIKGQTAILNGSYSLKRLNDWGYTTNSKVYKRIIYYKGSKTWQLLMAVAKSIGGQISYSK